MEHAEVTPKALWPNRSLLFRLYLMLAVGLVSVAALLDFGFRQLQAHLQPAADPWREAAVGLIAERIRAAAPQARAALAADLAGTSGVPVQVLRSDDVVGNTVAENDIRPLYDAEGRATWLIHDETHNIVIRIGPIEPPAENPWLGWIPPLFYLSIFVFVGLWLRPLLRDLDTITASTRAFAADYREARPTAARVSNLRELAENFDTMAARLKALIQGQKELTSALSHEMRTPLARIRFALAVIGNNSGNDERAELAAINEDVQEIDRLIATMLNYARLDHPDTQMDWQERPADGWLRQSIERSRLPGIDVRIEIDERVDTLRMDPRLMGLALSNLLVNACRHAAGSVRVSLTHSEDDYVLQVEDDGAGIPDADRERVFKAFTRLDGSRSRDTGGSGLGLAIVARIASLHGGKAAADRSESLSGARLRLRWPMAKV
jgi:signal transduction histidine kinase